MLRWEGRCSSCGEWGTLEEFEDGSGQGSSSGSGGSSRSAVFKAIGEVKGEGETGGAKRLSTGFDELDRVMGGGIMPGSITLLSGDPGIGKSTLLLQVSVDIASRGKVLYVAGEESINQVRGRFARTAKSAGVELGDQVDEQFLLTSDIQVEAVINAIHEIKPELVIVDSIQSMVSEGSKSYAGSVSQVRIVGQLLTRCAKDSGVPIIAVGQINKDGAVAGPKVLEHTVDCVLYLEGDEYNVFRILRGIKNRFGPTNEIGVFEMAAAGIKEVANPSDVFIQESDSVAGSCISAVLKGSRVVFVEVQALVVERDAEAGPLRRVANGFKKPRLDMLCAVLGKRGKTAIAGKDVFVNVVGGLQVNSPSIDLAVCKAIKSAIEDKTVSKKSVFLGEVGLTGGIRSFYGVELVYAEAKRLGYDTVVGPDIGINSSKATKYTGLKVVSEV